MIFHEESQRKFYQYIFKSNLCLEKREQSCHFFTDAMIMYIENPIDFTKKLLDLISEFSQTAVHEVNIQKSEVFWYTNEISETEIRKEIPFDKTTRKINYLLINLTKFKACIQKTTQH